MIKSMGNSMNRYSTSMRIHENTVSSQITHQKVTQLKWKGNLKYNNNTKNFYVLL